MIIWCPNQSCECQKALSFKPKTGFLMYSTHEDTHEYRNTIKNAFAVKNFQIIDAMERIGDDDNYCKICEHILSTTLGIALITKNTPAKSLYNIYLEIGLCRAFGREALIITHNRRVVPSDLEGKGVLPYKNLSDINSKILNWTDQIPKKIKAYNKFADISYSQFQDYEKFFDYSKKAIMLGDCDNSLIKLDQVFTNQALSEQKFSKRLFSEVRTFIGSIE